MKDNQKITVLHILEATTGGTRRHVLDLTTGLNKDVFSVSLICATRRDSAFLADIETMNTQGISITIIHMVRNIRPLNDFMAFLSILRHLKQNNIMIVHTHSSKAGFLGRLAARLAHIPVIIHTPHVFAFQMNINPLLKAFYFRMEQFTACFTDKIVCVSNNEMKVAVEAGLTAPEKFTVIENGIAPAHLSGAPFMDNLDIKPNDIVVGTIGRFTRQKNHSLFLSAAKQVVEQFPNTKFLLIGNGEIKVKLESLTDELSLRDNVQILDIKDGFASFYPVIDIFVSSSAWEGMPYTILDAMLCRKAIVATGVGGIPDIIDHRKTGLIVPPGNSIAMADAIAELLSEPELRATLGSNAGSVAETRFVLDNMIAKTSELYKSSLQEQQKEKKK
ncbi:MAG: glycosyltransferase family 4 protein [Kiritimatiellae bacterium]|nr:glycosyltransferase family 4 protein [Kiritimatiellia bacterium]